MPKHTEQMKRMELREMTEHEICEYLRATKPQGYDAPSPRLMEQRRLAMEELTRRQVLQMGAR